MRRYRLQLPTRRLAFGVSVTLSVAYCSAAVAGPDIHRCQQPDGTIAFQEKPCTKPAPEPEPEPAIEDEGASGTQASSDDFFDFVNPYDEGDEEFLIEETTVASELPPPVSQDRAECEKITRDAIDAIDLEMRRGYDAEDGERYKAELLELTRQLRACKEL